MISEIRNKVKKFLKETVGIEGEVRVITIEKEGDGWTAEAEVAEISQYLASIKPEYRVFEKHFYTVKLDANLEISSYRRKDETEEVKEI